MRRVLAHFQSDSRRDITSNFFLHVMQHATAPQIVLREIVDSDVLVVGEVERCVRWLRGLIEGNDEDSEGGSKIHPIPLNDLSELLSSLERRLMGGRLRTAMKSKQFKETKGVKESKELSAAKQSKTAAKQLTETINSHQTNDNEYSRHPLSSCSSEEDAEVHTTHLDTRREVVVEIDADAFSVSLPQAAPTMSQMFQESPNVRRVRHL